MTDPQFQSLTIASRAAREAARVFDSKVRQVLDEAIGPDNWTLADVRNRGELRERPSFTDVLWDGKLLATIHRSQLWEYVDDPAGDPSGTCIRWTLNMRIQMHVGLSNA